VVVEHRDIVDVVSRFGSSGSEDYRRQDEIAIELGGSFAHYSAILRELTSTPRRSLQVLEVGCGSGRYFHCLENVERLVGVDLSPDMIRHAENPVRQSRITARRIELVCGDAAHYDPGESRFDLIYSIGVLGEYAPLDSTVVSKLSAMLAPGGALFVTAVDASSRVGPPLRGKPSASRRIVARAFPLLPRAIRHRVNRRLSPHYVTIDQVSRAFQARGLGAPQISRYVHVSGWRGAHWDVLAHSLLRPAAA
jgi:SAM-dependent methyltransferase